MAMSTYNGHVIVEWPCLCIMAMSPYDDHVIIVEWTWTYSENPWGAARIQWSVRGPYSTGDLLEIRKDPDFAYPLCLQLWLSPSVYILNIDPTLNTPRYTSTPR